MPIDDRYAIDIDPFLRLAAQRYAAPTRLPRADRLVGDPWPEPHRRDTSPLRVTTDSSAPLDRNLVYPHHRNPSFLGGQRRVVFLRVPQSHYSLTDDDISDDIEQKIAEILHEKDGRIFTSLLLQRLISDEEDASAWQHAKMQYPTFSAAQIQEYLRFALHLPDLELLYIRSGVAGNGWPEVDYACIFAR